MWEREGGRALWNGRKEECGWHEKLMVSPPLKPSRRKRGKRLSLEAFMKQM
jgi:hypothetical protein